MSSSGPSNFLNEQFRGRTLAQVRQEILSQLKEAHAHLNKVMLDAISVAQHVFEAGDEGKDRLEYVIKGETNLMGVAELSSVEKLRRLFEAFNEKRDFLHLLDQSLRAEGCRSSSGTSRATRSWTTAASSPPPTPSASPSSGSWGLSAPPAWPTSASFQSST